MIENPISRRKEENEQHAEGITRRRIPSAEKENGRKYRTISGEENDVTKGRPADNKGVRG